MLHDGDDVSSLALTFTTLLGGFLNALPWRGGLKMLLYQGSTLVPTI